MSAFDGSTVAIGGSPVATPQSGAPSAFSGSKVELGTPVSTPSKATAFGGAITPSVSSTKSSPDVSSLIQNTKPIDTSKLFSSSSKDLGLVSPKSDMTVNTSTPSLLPSTSGNTSSFTPSNIGIDTSPKTPSITDLMKQNASISNTPEGRIEGLTKEGTYLDTEGKNIQDLNTKLVDAQSKVDQTSQKSIDAFNKSVNAFNDRVSNYQSRLSQYNEGVKTANTDKTITTKPNDLQSILIDKGVPQALAMNPVTDYMGQALSDATDKVVSFIGALDSSNTTSERLGTGIEATLGLANLALSPIGLLFKAADQIPVVNIASDGIEKYMQTVNDAFSQGIPILLDKIPNSILSQSTKDEVSKPLGDAAGFLTLMFVGGKAAETVGPMIKAKLDEAKVLITKDLITKNFPGKKAYFNSSQVKDIWQTNTLLTESEKSDILKTIGGDSAKIRDALKNGISIEVSPRTLVTLEDRPYWASIKEFFGAKSSEPKVISDTGGMSVESKIRGLLPSGDESLSIPIKIEDVHPVLKDEVNKALETHGEPVVHQALQDNLGFDAETAQKVIQGSTRATTPDEIQAKNQDVLGKVAPKEVANVKTENNIFYHGTKAPIKSISDLSPINFGDPQALYGPGIYLTSNHEIAKGYAQTKGKGPEGKVFSGKLVDGLKFLNLDKPLSDSESSIFNKIINRERGDLEAGNTDVTGKTGAEAVQILRGELQDAHIPKYEAHEDFIDLQQALEDEHGYNGFEHKGGIGKDIEHNVKILFDTGYANKAPGRLIKPIETEIKAVNKALNMQGGFINAEPLVKAVTGVADFLEATNKGIEASKNLDDSLYTIEKNAEADKVMALQLVEKTDISAKDVEAVYHYREDNSLPLTPKQKKIYEDSKPMREAINRMANKLKETIPINSEDRNSRYVKGKGNVLDRITKATKGIGGKGSVLGKSAPTLKSRVYKTLVDENGNRTLVAIKDGRVTAIKDKVSTDLGSDTKKISPRTKEFFDKNVTPALENLATDLGITHIRTTQNQKGLGPKAAGVSFTGKNLIKTKVGAPERVLIHEIGHQIDERYGMQEIFKKDDARNFGRDTSQSELRALADLRLPNDPTDTFKKYVRSGAEKMAVMFEAYLHVPEQFKEVAPNIFEKFEEFLGSHKELQPIKELSPSLVLTSKTVGGEHIGGIKGNTFIKDGKSYKIEEATTKEIEKNTNTRYHTNFFVNDLVTYLNLRSVERATDFLDAYKESAKFKSIGMKFGEGDAPKGWTTTINPSFRGYMLEPHVAAIMDKYASSMMKGKDPLHVLTGLNGFLRTTIFLNPFIHIPNIVIHWMVNRGAKDFANPLTMKRLVTTSSRAISAVMHQNSDYIEMLQSGAPLLYSSMETRNLHNALLSKMESEINKNPELDFVKKAMNSINPYVLSGKATWMINDIAIMQAVYEEMEKDPNKTMQQAIADVGAHIPNYRVPANKVLQFLNNPNISMFGAYHFGALRSYYEMAKTLTTGNTVGDEGMNTIGSKEAWKNRGDVLSKLMMLGIISLVIYPAIDEAIQKATGNPNAKMRRAGATTFPYNAIQVASGNMGISQFIQSVITPAVGTKELASQLFNVDMFTGVHVRDTNASAGEQAQEAFHHAENAVAPIAQYKKLDSGVQTPAQFAMSLVGISSPDSVKTKLINAEASAQSKVDKLDQTSVDRIKTMYDQVKKVGFGTSEGDALVADMTASDFAIYKDLKAVDTAKDLIAMKDKIQPIVEQAYKLGFGTPEADALVADMTDEEHAAYSAIKTILYGANGTGAPVYDAGTTTNDTSLLGTVAAYANAIRVDPITAFERIFTNQRILRTENGSIIVERNDKKEADVKKQLGGTTEMTLDHLKSFELGGDNSESNMWLIPKDIAAQDDQVENFLGRALAAGKINGAQAQEYEVRYKKQADAAYIDKRTQSTFDKVGSPLTFDALKELVK